MRRVVAQIGRRAGQRTLMLMELRNARERDRFRVMMEGLRTQGHVPEGAYAIASNLTSCAGELLIVLPPADGTGRMIQVIKGEAAMRLSLQVGEAEMSAQNYAVYTALAVHAESER